MNKKNNEIAAVLICMVTVGMPAANAAEFDALIRTSVGVSDNVSRAETDTIDETLLTLGFTFNVTEDTQRIDLDLRSTLDYIEYLDGTFEEQIIGGLDAFLAVNVIERYMRWTVQDTWGQQLNDPLRPARPDNLGNVNFFSTGPTFSFLGDSRNQLNLDFRYTAIDFENQRSDSERGSAILALGRDIRRSTNISLNFLTERAEFDEGDGNRDFDRRQAFFRLSQTGNRNTLGVSIGANEVELVESGEVLDGTFAQLDWTSRVSSSGTLTLGAGSRFSDQGNIFRFNRTNAPNLEDPTDNPISDSPFVNNFLALGYTLQRGQYSVNVTANFDQQDFKDQSGADRDILGGQVVVRRDLSRRTFATLRVRYRERDFKYQDREDENILFGLNLGYRVNAGFNVSIDFQQTRRETTVPGSSFDEDRVFLQFSYTPEWSR